MTDTIGDPANSLLMVDKLNFKRSRNVEVLHDISFGLFPDRTLCIVGETGAGKSTIARILCQLLKPTSGKIYLNGDLLSRKSRARIQMVFQDPYASLNPKRKIINIVSEPNKYNGRLKSAEIKQRSAELLKEVGLNSDIYYKLPGEISGGQCQRVAIARALAASPMVLICDEAVSSLDVSVQAQVLNLLNDLKSKLGFGLIFITHDLKVAKVISDDILVIYKGNVLEYAPSEVFFNSPKHPYSKRLIDVSRDPEAHKSVTNFDRPVPGGCPYKTRCEYYRPQCDNKPELSVIDQAKVACFFPLVHETN